MSLFSLTLNWGRLNIEFLTGNYFPSEFWRNFSVVNSVALEKFNAILILDPLLESSVFLSRSFYSFLFLHFLKSLECYLVWVYFDPSWWVLNRSFNLESNSLQLEDIFLDWCFGNNFLFHFSLLCFWNLYSNIKSYELILKFSHLSFYWRASDIIIPEIFLLD